MNSLQLTRGKALFKRAFKMRANQRAAKERKRMNPQPLPDEEEYVPPILPKLKFATVSIRCGSESISFRVYRADAERLICRGKAQAPSSIGRRVALILDSQL